MLAVVSAAALFSSAVTAPQAAAQSLAERLGLASRPAPAAAPQRVMRDPNVRPAAVAAAPRKRAMAAREQAMAGTQRRSTSSSSGDGGSFFSRLHLPSFSGNSGPQAGDEPPAAYGPSDEGSQGARPQDTNANRAPVRRPAAGAAGQSTASRGAAGTGTTAARPATQPRTTQDRTAAQAPAVTPRVARSSPRLDNRHNELADALTGLRDVPEPTGDEAGDDMGDADVSMPAATAGEAAPSYLDDVADRYAPTTDDAPAADAARGQSRQPIDVRDALLQEGTGEAAAAPAATQRSVPVAPPARRSVPQSAAPVRRSPARTPNVETDVAAALQADAARESEPLVTQQQEEPLGAISATPAPPTYEPVVTPAPPVSRPRNVSTTPSAAIPTQHGIGNLRPKPTPPKLAITQGDVLLSCRPPVIMSNVTGPQRIVVGSTAEYKVELENSGDGPAREMVATITVPASADVLDAAATNGAIDRIAAATEGGPHTIKWQLYELAAGASQTLTLKLIPRGGQPLQLAVQCEQAPTTVEALVDVQEPKLQMEIAGPSEVLFGKSQRYTLTLANPGTGTAEDVLIELTPPGGDPKSPVKHKVGTLAAGASKKIELELTAREAGDLKMLASASAAGELRTEAVKTVLCRRAELDVDWRGPEQNFAGSVATYYLRVRNPGTAPAEQVGVVLTLPTGAEMVDASTGHSWDAARRTVTWQPTSLASSEERFMQVRCRLSNPGINQMELVARTASGDLSDVQSVPVTVEALADLKLQVSDPEGVSPVGEAGLYEILVQNRGQIAARGVNVIAMFSEGIDPSHVEGGQHEIRDGRVSFRTIDTLPAGAEVVLRIHAKATQPGTHIFRTEVVCDDLQTKLVAEETSRYFVEEERWADASAAYSEGDAATR